MQTSQFARVLNRAMARGRVTAKDLAAVIDCTPDHIRAVARGDRHLPHPKAERISSWMADERGMLDQVGGMTGRSGATHFHPDELEIDGCLRSEIYDARNYFAAADSLLKAGDRDQAARQAQKGIQKAKAALADIQQPAE
jgi:hypothetical protein